MTFRRAIDAPPTWRIELSCDTCNAHIGTLTGDAELEVTAQRLGDAAKEIQHNHVCYTGLEPRS